eukprot:4006504-Prymnesium_polylepis.1
MSLLCLRWRTLATATSFVTESSCSRQAWPCKAPALRVPLALRPGVANARRRHRALTKLIAVQSCVAIDSG